MKNDPSSMRPTLKYHAVKGTVDVADRQSGKLARGIVKLATMPSPNFWITILGLGVFVLIGMM